MVEECKDTIFFSLWVKQLLYLYTLNIVCKNSNRFQQFKLCIIFNFFHNLSCLYFTLYITKWTDLLKSISNTLCNSIYRQRTAALAVATSSNQWSSGQSAAPQRSRGTWRQRTLLLLDSQLFYIWMWGWKCCHPSVRKQNMYYRQWNKINS